mmetsp:Transcript_40565/g.67793  ORF Transcript_40565/g.67793 Transcript_40565/m.67793 type:complete len:1064 (+) Transcript_40565:84-3275(+)
MGVQHIDSAPAVVETNGSPMRERILGFSTGLQWDGHAIGDVNIDAFKTSKEGDVEAVVSTTLTGDGAQVWLHWGVTMSADGGWTCPANDVWPPNTAKQSDQAVQTKFQGGPITIKVPASSKIVTVKFVIKRMASCEQWLSNGGDFVIPCQTMNPSQVGDKIVASECLPHWSMPYRFRQVLEYLPAAREDINAMGWIFLIMRLHYMKVLRWYSSHNYQSKDIAHVQDTLSKQMALTAVHLGKGYKIKRYARMTMGYLSRGGGQSEQIRLEILNIMRRHNIKEGHRPGIDDKFLEQWHQKLHQHTSVEDIWICEAYLHFLHTGNIGDFWKHLWDNHQVTRERLANLPHPINKEPFHLPQLIGDMKHYLWILKTVHGGADLSFIIEMSKWALEKSGDQEVIGWLYEIKQNANEWWIPFKVAEVRQRIVGPMKNVFSAERDLSLLDASLVGFFKFSLERQDSSQWPGDKLIEMIELVLSQASLSRDFDPEWEDALKQWRATVKSGQGKWGEEWALQSAAIADRVGLLLATEADEMTALLQPKVEQLGAALKIADQYVKNFTEEAIRAQPSFLISGYLCRLVPMIRAAAKLGRWQIISAAKGSAVGAVQMLPNLDGIQGKSYVNNPQILLVEKVGGNDDIPLGVVALVTSSSSDVLSHVAIRARNQHVLFATTDAELFNSVKSSIGSTNYSVKIAPDGSVEFKQSDAAIKTDEPTKAANGVQTLTLKEPKPWTKYVLQSSEFGPGLVGGKSQHLTELASKLPSYLSAPTSVALPFGTMEHVFDSDVNKEIKAEVSAALVKASDAVLKGESPAATLEEVRDSFMKALKLDNGLKDALTTSVLGTFSKAETASSTDTLWAAVKSVWSSKWTDRAFLSRTAHKIPDSALFMAVLIQPVIKAQYAFVLHTAHPITGNRDEVFGEVVIGRGETLVGNYPGRAFSFSAKKPATSSESIQWKILSYPSKRVGLFAADGGLMVRSDSNGEDLEDFAGAGLYDSVVCGARVTEQVIAYSSEKLFTDPTFRSDLIQNLVKTAVDVERAMGGTPQDIEGVVGPESPIAITIVQTRPQVL